MPSITISREQSAFLERTARRISDLRARKVTKREILGALLEIAIEDEGIYDPHTSEPVDPYRRRICQAERESRTASFDVESLLTAVRS